MDYLTKSQQESKIYSLKPTNDSGYYGKKGYSNGKSYAPDADPYKPANA